MRIGHSMLAVLGLAVTFSPLPVTAQTQATKQAQAIDTARIQQLITDPNAARTMLESGSAAEVGWSWFVWLNSPLTGGDPKTWESWRGTSSVYLPNGQQPPGWGQTPRPPQTVMTLAQQQGLNTNLPFHNLDSDV